MKKYFRSIPISVLLLMSISLLAINDFYLKLLYPGFLTGKISDVVGLFAFSLLFSIVLPRKKIEINVLIAIGFLIWKVPAMNAVILVFNTILPFQIGRTIDYSDYWALLVLPVSYFYCSPSISWNDSKLFRSAIAMCACAIFCASAFDGTHGHIKTYSYNIAKYQLQNYIDSTFAHYPELHMPKDGTFYEKQTDPYFSVYLVDEHGPEVYIARYYGDKSYWDKSPNNAKFMIVYVADYGQKLKKNADLSSKEKSRVIEKFNKIFIYELGSYIMPQIVADDNE